MKLAITLQQNNISGYQFLCEILGEIHQQSEFKNTLLLRAQSGDAMDKEEAKLIQAEFTELIQNVKKSRSGLLKQLHSLLISYCNDDKSLDFINHFNEKDGIIRLFLNRTGTTNHGGIAAAIVAAAGFSNNPDFFIGSQEVRMIATKSMECLGYNNADFIPDACFNIDQNGYLSDDTIHLLFLSLYGALKVKYPHKASNEYQRRKRLEEAQNALDTLINSDHDSVIFSALRNSREMSRICQGMLKTMEEKSGQIVFPNNCTIPLHSFYAIPKFEIMNGSAEILRRDHNFYIRSLVIGKLGSGKSLLTKAIVRTCLDSHASPGPDQSYNERYQEYATTLGLDKHHYLPLVLNCKEIPQDADFQNLDLIKEAVLQLMRLTRTSSHADCLTHWNEFATQVISYYKHRAKNASLLLIIEDLSWLNRNACDAFLKNLKQMETCEYRIHILVISQRLINSQMARFADYNRVEIAPLTRSLEQEIDTLVSLGVGFSNSDVYRKLISSNRCVRSFLDSPKHLIKLLCHPFEESFDINELLRQTIDEQLEQHNCPDITDEDCREFLTALAVNIAENKRVSHFSYRNFAADYKNIPRNIVDRGILKCLDGKLVKPQAVWQHIMDNMILVCPNSGISSYAFVNQLYYCSLVADHYLSLIGTLPAVNWLDHFNRMSAEDFSIITVMLLERLCQAPSADYAAPTDISGYDLLILVQSIVAYVMSRTDPTELYHCLLALNDILSNNHLKYRFNLARQMNLWNMFEQISAVSYQRFEQLSDDQVKLERLRFIEQLPI